MTILFGLGLVVLALTLAQALGRPSRAGYRPSPPFAFPDVTAAVEEVAPLAPPLRTSRPALQTGAAILAVALALDVSGASLVWASPEPPAAIASSELIDFSRPDAVLLDEAPLSWTLSTIPEGWFV